MMIKNLERKKRRGEGRRKRRVKFCLQKEKIGCMPLPAPA